MRRLLFLLALLVPSTAGAQLTYSPEHPDAGAAVVQHYIDRLGAIGGTDPVSHQAPTAPDPRYRVYQQALVDGLWGLGGGSGTPSCTLSGDATGACASNVVTAIQGRAIDAMTSEPGDTYLLQWSHSGLRWVPEDPAYLSVSHATTANTCTNGLVSTGSYSDPSWLTSIAGSKVSGAISGKAATCGTADVATNGLVSTGSYSSPSWLTSILGSIVSGNISGNAANVTGTVGVGNGGTGLTSGPSAATHFLGGLASGGGFVWSERALTATDIPALSYLALHGKADSAGTCDSATTAGSATTASSASSATTCAQLQGYAVDSGAPTDGYALAWSAAGSKWQATEAGGDVAGKLGALTVGQLQGHTVSNAAPSTG